MVLLFNSDKVVFVGAKSPSDAPIRAGITNQSAVRDDLDSLGFVASKLWNVARWTAGRIWSETGPVPGDGELKAYLK